MLSALSLCIMAFELDKMAEVVATAFSTAGRLLNLRPFQGRNTRDGLCGGISLQIMYRHSARLILRCRTSCLDPFAKPQTRLPAKDKKHTTSNTAY